MCGLAKKNSQSQQGNMSEIPSQASFHFVSQRCALVLGASGTDGVAWRGVHGRDETRLLVRKGVVGMCVWGKLVKQV